jgi:hypothetical protein
MFIAIKPGREQSRYHALEEDYLDKCRCWIVYGGRQYCICHDNSSRGSETSVTGLAVYLGRSGDGIEY